MKYSLLVTETGGNNCFSIASSYNISKIGSLVVYAMSESKMSINYLCGFFCLCFTCSGTGRDAMTSHDNISWSVDLLWALNGLIRFPKFELAIWRFRVQVLSLTNGWICNKASRVQIVGHAMKIVKWSASHQLGFFKRCFCSVYNVTFSDLWCPQLALLF